MLPAVLAPRESGAQLLRLPTDEFISRCLESDGVTEEQAKAFHAKFWQLHVDSQRNSGMRNSDDGADGSREDSKWLSSRDNSERKTLHFTERIRPGMAVRWTPAELPSSKNEQNLALVLSPQEVVEGNDPSDQRYVCAMVLPGVLGDSYEVHLWRQVVVDVQQMQAEVLLEYDVASRYYHVIV